MPQAIQLSTGFFTAAAAGTGVATPNGGDTFAVQNFPTSSPCYLENVWANGASTDFVRIRSPRMHDANQGIRLQLGGSANFPLLPFEVEQELYPADALTVEIDETAAATGAIALFEYYTDLPGTSARLASWAEVAPRVQNISGVQVTAGAIAAIGNYGASVAINSGFDNFQAGADYALLGYTVAASRLAIAIQGQDTGNLKVGGPGSNDARVTRDWFIKVGEAIGRPCIPIIAANNKGSTNVMQADNAASAAVAVTLILAELG